MKKTLLIIITVALTIFAMYVLITNFVTSNDSSNSTDTETSEVSSVSKKPTEIESEVLDYFYDIALGSEYGDSKPIIQKWDKSIIEIGTNGSYTEKSEQCLDQTIVDFNMLSKDVRLQRTSKNPDITIHFAPEASFSSILQQYRPTNLGYFWTWSDSRGVLNKATVMIDTSRTSDTEKCHLIREELTQSLGLMNDSPKFPDSMFYTEWSYTSTYSEIDERVISILYGDDRIKPMMDRSEIESLYTRK